MGGRSIGGIRAFVAILLPDTVRAALGGEIELLRPVGRNVAWVAPDNLHVTLKFLGNLEPERLDRAASALAGVASAATPFELAIVGLGAFPSPTRPRVLWVGLGAGAGAAARLAVSVEGALAGQGFAPEDRPFAGHITLGRVREPRRDDGLASALTAGAGRRIGRLAVDQLALMRSEPSPRGPRYSVVAAWPLSASAAQGTTTTTR